MEDTIGYLPHLNPIVIWTVVKSLAAKAFRKAAPKDVVEIIEYFYTKSFGGGKEGGMEASFCPLASLFTRKRPFFRVSRYYGKYS